MKRCVLLILALLLAVPAAAELIPNPTPETESGSYGTGEALYALLLPLIDERIGGDLADQSVAGEYVGMHPVASQLDAEGKAVVIMGSLYRGEGPFSGMTPEEKARVIWLDRQAVAVLRRDPMSLLGWRLDTISYDDAMAAEEVSRQHFTGTMLDWHSEDGSVSLQYPALFGPLTSRANGDGAEAADGSASILVTSVFNETGLTLSALDASLRSSEPTVDIVRNDASGVLRVTCAADGWVRAEYTIVTEDMIHQVIMTWTEAVNETFLVYSDYVMNSFCAEALGVG